MIGVIKTIIVSLISLVALLAVLTIFDVISFESAKENSLRIFYATLVIIFTGLLVNFVSKVNNKQDK